jgi:amidase
MVRGLAMTRKALESAGHKMLKWIPVDHPVIPKELNLAFHTLNDGAIVKLTEEHDEPVSG